MMIRDTLFAAVLMLSFVITPVTANDGAAAAEPDIEGIHIESLLAQSVGMERRFQSQNLIYGDKGVEDYLTEILETLVTPEERALYRFRVRVLRSNVVNAFAAPHGSIFITTALLARVTSEAQAAAILSHELIHIINHHAAKNLILMKEVARRQTPARQRMALLLGDGVAGSITGAALTSAMSGYSRELEREADSVGLLRMAAAGYPHEEFNSLFVMLSGHLAAENISEPYFFSTHPRMVERIENYKRIVSGGALPKSGAGKVTDTAAYKPDNIDKGYFCIKIRNVILHDAEMNRAAGKFYMVEEQLDRLLAVDGGDVAALVMRGDMERMLSPRSTAFVPWYERALESDPLDLSALRAAGFAYHAIGDGENARQYLKLYCKLAGDGAPDIKMAKDVLRRIGGTK